MDINSITPITENDYEQECRRNVMLTLNDYKVKNIQLEKQLAVLRTKYDYLEKAYYQLRETKHTVKECLHEIKNLKSALMPKSKLEEFEEIIKIQKAKENKRAALNNENFYPRTDLF